METQLIKKSLALLGADLNTEPGATEISYSIDVRNGMFRIQCGKRVDMKVVGLAVKDKHLLLQVTEPATNRNPAKHKFLLGHDERDWFVAAIPEAFTWVKNVTDAKEALKPWEVLWKEKSLPGKAKNKRRNKVRVRQGEWFFVPAPQLNPVQLLIFKNEPLSRGAGSKPHMVDEVYRTGGEKVFVSRKFPRGISEEGYKKIITRNPNRKAEFTMMNRNAEVFARGRVKHNDHATIFLDGWHKVVMNTEAQALSRKNLAFLD